MSAIVPLGGCIKIALTAVTGTTAGGGGTIANPEGEDVMITRAWLDVTTPATGAANVDVGVGATAATSSDNLIDGQSVGGGGTTDIRLDNIMDHGTNGKPIMRWGSTEYVTVTASASLAGLVGNLYVEYRHI